MARDIVPGHNTPYRASLMLKNFHLFKKLPSIILRMAGRPSQLGPCLPPPCHVPHHSLFKPYGPRATFSHWPPSLTLLKTTPSRKTFLTHKTELRDPFICSHDPHLSVSLTGLCTPLGMACVFIHFWISRIQPLSGTKV